MGVKLERMYYYGRLVDKIALEIRQTRGLSPEDMLNEMVRFLSFFSSLRKDDCSWEKLKDIFLGLIRRLDEEKILYAVTGGFAVVMYGRPRTTLDVDIIVDVNDITELNKLLDIAKASGFMVSDYDFMLAFRERSRAVGIHSEIPVFRLDIVFASEIDKERLRRARSYHIECTPVRIVRVEDLIPYLIMYGKIEDALFLLRKYRDTIDLALMENLSRRLGVYEKLMKLLTRPDG